jgi:Asp-tRNA(Asn)/Glu-tRNA(Gln) amidotransferase A subunit family amidase
VAVALGLAAVSIGYDGGGSIRTPASLSGVYGLATGFGRVPFSSHTVSTNIKSGPFATTTLDVALAYAVIARRKEGFVHYDELYDGDFGGVPTAALGAYFESAPADLGGVVIGIYPRWAADCDAEVKRLFDKALASLVARGAVVKEIAIPHLNLGRLAHAVKISTEFGLMWDGALSHPGEAKDLLEPNTRVTVGLGHSVTAVEALAADRLRGYVFEHVKAIFREVDVIATPTTSLTAPKVAEGAKKYGESNTVLTVELTKYIFLGNWLGLPGMNCPIGFDATNNNMPVGFQIIGDHWGEDKVLRVAKSLESLHPWVPPRDFSG